MFGKIVRVFGILLIILLSAACIFFSIVERDMDLQNLNTNFSKILTFPGIFEDRFYDWRMQKTLPPTAYDDRLVLVKIDEPSLQTPSIGRWPFTRMVWVKFMHKMESFGAKVVAFDVFFPEPEKTCVAEHEGPDIQLAQAIREFQMRPGYRVILPYSLNVDGYKTEREFKEVPDSLFNFVADTRQAKDLNLKPMSISKDAWPVPTLVKAESGLAHIESSSDSDGIYRHYQFIANVDELYFPSFGVMTYQYYTEDKPVLELMSLGEYHLKIKDGSIRLNQKGEARVRWFGDQNAYPGVSLKDVLAAPDTDPKMIQSFKDKIVFIASTAFGAHDFRHTPIDPQLPGIFFHMNVVSMLLNGTYFRSAADSTLYSWLILIFGTLIMVLVQIFGLPLLDLGVVASLIIGLFYLDTYYLLPRGYEIKLFFCLFSIGACYAWNTFLNFYNSNKDKAFLKQAFGTYISPELIDEMYKTGTPPQLGGTEGIITAYFTDIAGFSTFSEKLTATQLVELLNEYLTAMTDILLEEGGTLDKYEGDAIIAFFGAPMPMPDHAERAVRVSIKMQERLAELRAKWKSEAPKWPEIVHHMRMRIGINSGSIVTGNMGSAQRMNYTMMGDSVNLAARLEAAAKQYGIFTQIAAAVKNLIGDTFVLRELDTLRVVGKSEPVTTYDVLGLTGKTDENLLKLQTEFHKGLALYKAQKWDEAIETFKVSNECENLRYPELAGKKTNPSLIYIERCEYFKQNPPGADWDGVYTLTEK